MAFHGHEPQGGKSDGPDEADDKYLAYFDPEIEAKESQRQLAGWQADLHQDCSEAKAVNQTEQAGQHRSQAQRQPLPFDQV